MLTNSFCCITSAFIICHFLPQNQLTPYLISSELWLLEWSHCIRAVHLPFCLSLLPYPTIFSPAFCTICVLHQQGIIVTNPGLLFQLSQLTLCFLTSANRQVLRMLIKLASQFHFLQSPKQTLARNCKIHSCCYCDFGAHTYVHTKMYLGWG